MADLGQWLHALFSPQAAYGQTQRPAVPLQTAAPVTRVGNVYQGQMLPAGKSSLLALSEDQGGTAKAGRPARSVKKREAQVAAAGSWLDDMFRQTAADHPNLRLPSDRWADRMLDRTFFDPNSPNNAAQRRAYALDEWWRKINNMNGGPRY